MNVKEMNERKWPVTIRLKIVEDLYQLQKTQPSGELNARQKASLEISIKSLEKILLFCNPSKFPACYFWQIFIKYTQSDPTSVNSSWNFSRANHFVWSRYIVWKSFLANFERKNSNYNILKISWWGTKSKRKL